MKSTLNLLMILFGISAFGQNILAEHHFEAKDVERVVINGVFCDVEVTGESDRVIFDGIIKGDGKEGDYLIASIRNGSTVIFKVESKSTKKWGWNDINFSKLTLQIPDNVTLKIENTSGDITIDDYAGDDLDVKATSGDISLKRINADVSIRTTSGDVVVRGIEGEIRTVSTSGDQEYFGIDGELQAEATSGDIDVNKVVGDIMLGATSGDLELDGIKGAIKARTTSGEIEGDYITLAGNSSFRTTSGEIYMILENELDELSFDLRASSGDLRVGGIRSEDHLVLKKGNIMIQGVSTSGDQTYKH